MVRQKQSRMIAGYGINELLFSLYTAFVISAVYEAQIAGRLGNRLLIPFWLLLYLILFVLSSLVAQPLLCKVSSLQIHRESQTVSRREQYAWGSCLFIIAFLAMIVWYLIYYPGWFTGDSEDQLRQAMTGEYNDWHPVLQTFFTFTVPLALTGGWKGSIVLFQILEYAAALTYMCMTFLRFGNRKYALISLLAIVINPLSGAIVKQPWKDITFTIFCVLFASFALRLWFEPDWLNKPHRVVGMATVAVAATIVRHNGILFTLPMLLAVLLLTAENKHRAFLLILSAILFLLVKGPFYSFLEVTDPGSRSIEILGLPMTVIGDVVTQDPESLDKETLDFAWSVAEPEAWEEYYRPGDFNSLKFSECCNTQIVNDAGIRKVLSYMLRCFRASPAKAFEGLLTSTNMVYALSGPISWTPAFFPPIVYSLIESSLIRWLSLYIGIPMFFCILFSLGRAPLNSGVNRKKLLFLLPILIHNFGTMLLLTGPDFRFFYLTYPITAVIIFLMLSEWQRGKETGE